MKVIGWIGLGEKGFPTAQQLVKDKTTVVAYDSLDANRKRAADAGIVTTSSVQAVAMHLPLPRLIFLNEDASLSHDISMQLAALLSQGDMVVNLCKKRFPPNCLTLYKSAGIMHLQFLRTARNEKLFTGDSAVFELCLPILNQIHPANSFSRRRIEK